MKLSGGILWIDDNPDREKRATQLGEDTGMNVEFISLKGKDVEAELPGIRRRPRPGLVIVDHVLNNTKSEMWARFGSTLAGFFRETWPGRPIFGITAAKNLKEIDVETQAYDELIDFTEFSKYVAYLPQVVEGFEKCAKVKSLDEWIGVMKCPNEEVERMRICLPHELKMGFNKPGFANRAYRWFRRICYGLPGFLYDRDWVATFAGVKQNAIDKYLKYFNGAEYAGVFNDPDDPRWWKAKLYQMLYTRCEDENASYRSTQDVANELLKVTDDDRSKCRVCRQKWPEILAYVGSCQVE